MNGDDAPGSYQRNAGHKGRLRLGPDGPAAGSHPLGPTRALARGRPRARAPRIVESSIAKSGHIFIGTVGNLGYCIDVNKREPEAEVAEEKCGRLICAWCVPPRDLGPAPGFQPGEFTHGICPGCRTKFFPATGEGAPARAAGANGGDGGGRVGQVAGGAVR